MMTMKPETQTATGGTVGGAIGVLIVLFMPESVYVFTPATAATATAALGIIASYGMGFMPKPSG